MTQLDEQKTLNQSQTNPSNISDKPKGKNFQQLTLAEYEALKVRKARKFRIKIPPQLKVILGTPFVIIFCFGIFFVPYMLYLIATSKPAPQHDLNKRTQNSAASADKTSSR